MQPYLKSKIWFSLTFIALTLINCVSIVHAARWEFTPSIIGDVTYSNNIGLDPDGEEEEDYIFEINPAFEAKREGPRLSTTFNYLMQNILSVKQGDSNETFHQFFGDAKGEVLRETFFVDAITTFSQQIIDPEGRVSTSNRNRTGNRSDTFAAGISPYWQQRLGNVMQANLRYSYRIVNFLDKENANNINNNIQDSREHNVRLDFTDPLQRRLTWASRYEWSQIEFEDDRTDKFQSANLTLDYQLSRIIGVFATGGYEKNDFERNVSNGKTEGETWEVGVRLEPTTRDLIEARYGQRFFGNTRGFLWTHTARRITTEFKFFEDLTTGNQTLLGTDFTPGQGINTDVPRRRGEPFTRKRFDATITLELPKSTISINGFHVRRTFQTTAEKDRNNGAVLSWLWQLRPRTEFSVSLTYVRNRFGSGNNRNNEGGWIEMQLLKQFGPRTDGYIQASYRRRDADQLQDEYRENRVSLGVARRF